MKRPDLITAIVIFVALVGGYAVAAIYYPMAYIWATYEDLFGEWTQFWLFVVTFLVSVRILFSRTRYRVTFALLAISCLYVSLEEISWGQRIFNFDSPDFFKQHNLQSETNLHNFLTGPFSTTLKATLTYVLAGGMIAYGLVYPMMLSRRWRLAVWLDARGIASPPVASIPFLLVGGVLEAGPFSFNEAEVAELLVGFSVAIMAIHYAYSVRRDLDPRDTTGWSLDNGRALAVRYAVTSLVVISIAGNTTLAIYATPRGKTRIDTRIENGIEKFAGRYARYEQWDTSIGLMRRLHERHPTSRSTLRKLATALAEAGQNEEAEARLQDALRIDLRRLQRDPGAASVHRSIVRTYRLLGDTANAEKHLRECLRIGLDRIAEHPDGANAAYSLGRTYELVGRDDEALEQFERAHSLKPTSKKFKKAYLRAKNR
jgi:tetratricopeptide repeat protein